MKKFLTLIIIMLFHISYSQTISELNTDGNIIVNGETFLPIGFYCEGLPLDEYPNIPQTILDAGFNVIYTESTIGNISDYDEFLNTCETLGLKNIIGLPYSFIDPTDYEFYINELKDYPSIFAWNILDDANNFGVSEIEIQRNILLSLDSSRITSASWYLSQTPFQEMTPFVEIVSMQDYPWEDALENDLVFTNSKWRETAIIAESSNQFAMATPQAFNWDDGTYPSPAHLDCQSYLGFVTGLKGILYYTFKDYDNDSTIDVTQPEIFQSASQIAGEILETELKDVILFGEHEYFNIDFYRYYATWRYNGYLYLIAVNANDELAYNYNIPLPDDVIGQPINFFSYRPDDLTIVNGNLTGILESYQVAIYKMNTNVVSTSAHDIIDCAIFPNPASKTLNISSSLSNLSFEMYNATGELIRKGELIHESFSVDVSRMKSGLYFIRFKDRKGTNVIVEKIVIR